MTEPSQHFSWAEAACHDGTAVPDELRPNIIKLCTQLEVLRADLGQPIHVDDMYRTPAHNSTVGGAPSSQHLLGKAADIRVDGLTPTQLRAAIQKLIAAECMLEGGVGLYSSFVHYDIRGHRARWSVP